MSKISFLRLWTGLSVADAWTRLRDHRQGRRALAAMLAKADDHLIDDIGVTRDELQRLLHARL